MTATPFTLDRQRRRPKLGLTPLIDIVFILLLFFMLSSTFADRRTVDLATPSVSVGTPTTDDVVVVELTTQGIHVNGRYVSQDRLGERLSHVLSRVPGRSLAVRVEVGVSLQAMVRVVDAAGSAGATAISLQRADRT